jgi:hypothetical protein
MAFLYISPKGIPWKKHSYTAGNTFDSCPLKYKLQKIHGWKEKANRARFEFGKAFESAIQFYHENQADLQAAIAHFRGQWAQYQDQPLEYTKVEKDWANCQRIGIDWLRLYAIRQPSLPIPIGGMSIFQREVSKEVFPGDENYGEIEDTGKLDIIAYNPPDHPMLPKLDWKPEYGAFRPLIVDIKTAGSDFPETYGIAAYDSQLRRYSWLSGIRDVALLWFVKRGFTLQKGYSVTLLEDADHMKAGEEAVIAMVDEEGLWVVPNDFLLEEMDRIAKNAKTAAGKGKKESAETDAKMAWLEEYGVWTTADAVTKQRLQFNAGFVTVESAEDAGKVAQDQIIRIVNAWKNDNYPNKFGVRYPKDDKSDPYFRAFVLKDQMYLKQNFTKSDEDVDIFADEDTEAL